MAVEAFWTFYFIILTNQKVLPQPGGETNNSHQGP